MTAAVHANRLAGGEFRVEEEEDGPRDFVRAPPLPEGRCLFDRFVFLV
jgi:hypothetical protein